MAYSGALRFGVWGLVHGSLGSFHHPADPPVASWSRVRRQVIDLEDLGYDFTLLAQQTIHPHGDYDVVEPWTACAALAEATTSIEIIAAIKPLLYHPVPLAKMALQIEDISEGRFAMNLVNAWFKPELERSGIGFPEHSERHAYGRDWFTVVDRLIRGERVTHHGPFFDIDDLQLRPASRWRSRPRIYSGGESPDGRQFAAEFADDWFVFGRPAEELVPLLEDVRSRPRPGGAIGLALTAFVVARETAEEARAAWDALVDIALADVDEVARLATWTDTSAVSGDMIRDDAANRKATADLFGKLVLVGSYDEVAAEVRAIERLGITSLLLSFQPYETEVRRFAAEVIPRVRRLAAAA